MISFGGLLSHKYEVNDPGDKRRGHAVDNDGAGYDEHFDGEAGDKAFGFELYRRGDDGVGKAGYGDESSRAGELGDVVKDVEGSEHRGYGDEGHRHGR